MADAMIAPAQTVLVIRSRLVTVVSLPGVVENGMQNGRIEIGVTISRSIGDYRQATMEIAIEAGVPSPGRA
jgi:hypothetical protein